MIFKTTIIKHNGVHVEDYINTPIIDRVTTYVDLNEGIIHGNDKSKIIGIITDAKDIGNNEIELTITLRKNKFQGEYMKNTDGSVTPMSFSMGFDGKIVE
jgi:hypothetical protein